MRKIFLDLGTHYGEGLRKFIDMYNMDETWEIFTFEANPRTYDKFVNEFAHLTPGVTHFNRAVSNNNNFTTIKGEIYEPDNEIGTGQGSSISDISEEYTGLKYIEYRTQCIDISDFIRVSFSKDDFIIVKMDIEGAEYEALAKMYLDGTIFYINDIYIEWHSRMFKNVNYKMQQQDILVNILKKSNINYNEWE